MRSPAEGDTNAPAPLGLDEWNQVEQRQITPAWSKPLGIATVISTGVDGKTNEQTLMSTRELGDVALTIGKELVLCYVDAVVPIPHVS